MSQQTNGIYEFGPFHLDAWERLLQRDGATISLTPKAFDLLLVLVERHGRLVEKEELFQAVWPDTIVEESNLSSNIALIRKALGDGTNGERYIETVPKRGYRFVADARATDTPRRRFQLLLWPLLWITLASSLLIVGYFATVRWFAARNSSVVPPLTTAPFTTLPGIEKEPAFAPDGNALAFTWDGEQGDNTDIYVKQIGNESLLRLTTNPAIEHWPRWSPDGRQIVFDSRAGGSVDIYVISAEGGQPRRLTTEPSEDNVPSWSHDGNWIYFCSDRSGSQQIWKMPATGGAAVQVTKQGGFDNVESPDGQFLYYAKARFVPGIWRVPVAGGEETLVLDQHRAGELRFWAVTAQGIYFASAEKPDQPLIEFYSFASGKVTTAVTLEKGLQKQTSGLAISPDGRWLTWSQIDQVSSDIMLVENFR